MSLPEFVRGATKGALSTFKQAYLLALLLEPASGRTHCDRGFPVSLYADSVAVAGYCLCPQNGCASHLAYLQMKHIIKIQI